MYIVNSKNITMNGYCTTHLIIHPITRYTDRLLNERTPPHRGYRKVCVSRAGPRPDVGCTYDNDEEGKESAKDMKPTGYGFFWMEHDGVCVVRGGNAQIEEMDGPRWPGVVVVRYVRLRVRRKCIETYNSSDQS